MSTTADFTKVFPEDRINIINQCGRAVSPTYKGVSIKIHLKNDMPVMAEIFDTETQGERIYSTVGLWFEGKKLTDYDGAFCCPPGVLDILKEMGYDVAEIEESQKD